MLLRTQADNDSSSWFHVLIDCCIFWAVAFVLLSGLVVLLLVSLFLWPLLCYTSLGDGNSTAAMETHVPTVLRQGRAKRKRRGFQQSIYLPLPAFDASLTAASEAQGLYLDLPVVLQFISLWTHRINSRYSHNLTESSCSCVRPIYSCSPERTLFISCTKWPELKLDAIPTCNGYHGNRAELVSRNLVRRHVWDTDGDLRR